MAALDGDVLIHKYELFNDMAVALAELQAGLRDRMTPKDILGMILEAEPVDPVKHGRWIFSPDHAEGICTRCNYKIYGRPYQSSYLIVPYNYCPNCGAKMDEEG